MSAWTELGTELSDVVSAHDAMKAGRLLRWNVRKVPMYATLPERDGVSRQLEVTDRVAVVRSNPESYLSIVSHGYEVIANEDYAPMLDQLARDSGSPFTTAGSVDGGRCAFVTARLPGELHAGVYVELAALWDHGGYKPFQILVTPVDAETGAVLAVEEVGRVRHSPGALAASDGVVHSALDRAFDYLDRFQAVSDQMRSVTCNSARLEHILERSFGAALDAPAATRTRTRGRHDQILDDYDGSTAWDAFVRMADWFDHSSAVRNGTPRAYKAIFDPGFKTRTLNILKEMA